MNGRQNLESETDQFFQERSGRHPVHPLPPWSAGGGISERKDYTPDQKVSPQTKEKSKQTHSKEYKTKLLQLQGHVP